MFLAWRIPGAGAPGGLLSMGSHRVGHDWSGLAASVAVNVEWWAHSSSALNLWEAASEAGAGFVSYLAGVWVSSGLVFPWVKNKAQFHFGDLISCIQHAVTQAAPPPADGKELQGAVRREGSPGGRQSRQPGAGWVRPGRSPSGARGRSGRWVTWAD